VRTPPCEAEVKNHVIRTVFLKIQAISTFEFVFSIDTVLTQIMARMGVTSTLYKQLKSQKQNCEQSTPGSVRLVHKKSNVLINRSLMINNNRFCEYLGLKPHGTNAIITGNYATGMHVNGMMWYELTLFNGNAEVRIYTGDLEMAIETIQDVLTFRYIYCGYTVYIDTSADMNINVINLLSETKAYPWVGKESYANIWEAFQDIVMFVRTLKQLPEWVREPLCKFE